MEDQKNTLRKLLQASTLTNEEKKWLLRYLETTDTSELGEIMRLELVDKLAQQLPEDKDRTDRMLRVIHERIGVQPAVRKLTDFRFFWYAAACAACLLLIAIYRPWKSNSEQPVMASNGRHKDGFAGKAGAAGGSRALLTLADGSTIVLDSAHDGNITKQGSTQVFKFNGSLNYKTATAGADSQVFNSLSTPRGGQYAVTLPDGSQVWLNAASSIRFPTAFAGQERRVEITGEAYFEVAKNEAMPFVVQAGNAEIRVLGTHFDIMAYHEEPALKTTLLEGAIRFTSGGGDHILRPGQQLKMNSRGDIHIDNGIDGEDVIAWKNGLFHFDGTDIQAVMRQLARWYNVEVVYSAGGPKELFHADIPRNVTLAEALRALELTEKVQFETNGETVTVKPRQP